MLKQPWRTDMYEGMLAETTTIAGYNGKDIRAYFARPLGPGPFPGVVLLHHAPGWDEWYREASRRFAHHGYLALCPNLYYDFGDGVPEDVAANRTLKRGMKLREHLFARKIPRSEMR
jgi:carboxymethylenebutenolidase